MSRLGPLKTLFKAWMVFYLVTHGVSLPADSSPEFSQVARGWLYAVVDFLRGHWLAGRWA